jgi:hypothetical protein
VKLKVTAAAEERQLSQNSLRIDLIVISIIVAVTASIIIAGARTVIIASSPDVIGRPAPINVNGAISVIVARGGSRRRQRSQLVREVGGRANHDSRSNGIDTPRHCENIQSAKCCQQKHQKLRSNSREGFHDNKVTTQARRLSTGFVSYERIEAPVSFVDD